MDDIPLGVRVQTEVEPVVGKSANVTSKKGGRVRPCSMFLHPRGNVFEEWSNVEGLGTQCWNSAKGWSPSRKQRQ